MAIPKRPWSDLKKRAVVGVLQMSEEFGNGKDR
jgi:hypothetical protein